MKPIRVMIVEDEAIPAMFLQHTLEKLGHSITATVSSGEEALQQVAADQPDVVIMDVRLGGDMDGVLAAQTIRKATGIQSIIVSAYGSAELQRRYGSEIDMACVSKPISENDLLFALEKVFDGS